METSLEQSRELKEIIGDKNYDFAYIYHTDNFGNPYYELQYRPRSLGSNDVPAWSDGALLALLPEKLTVSNSIRGNLSITKSLSGWVICYEGIDTVSGNIFLEHAVQAPSVLEVSIKLIKELHRRKLV